jgi:hypothetical protein
MLSTQEANKINLSRVRNWISRVFRILKKNPDRFLNHVSGIVHVGANTGQERELYESLGLHVLWVEPIPEVFTQLETNIARFRNQRALQALVTDVDDREYEFHIANNGGASSSILELKQHRDIWPGVEYTRAFKVTKNQPLFSKAWKFWHGYFHKLEQTISIC